MSLFQEKHQASCNKSREGNTQTTEISENLQGAKTNMKSMFQYTASDSQTYDCLPQVFLLLDYKFCAHLRSLASAPVLYLLRSFTRACLWVS